MGGEDTIRGVSFQTAYALSVALDVVGNPAASALVIEGEEDIVDLEVLGGSGPSLLACQVKTKAEPSHWKPSEIADIIRRWLQLEALPLKLEFVTDGHLGSGAVELKKAISTLASGVESKADRARLSGHGLADLTATVASRIDFVSRVGDASSVYSRASDKLARLSSPVSSPLPEDLDAALDRLFRRFSFEGGDPIVQRRTFSRESLADEIGIGLEELDSSQGWSVELRKVIVNSWRMAPVISPATEIDRILVGDAPLNDIARKRGLLRVGETEPVSVDELLGGGVAAIAGGAGSGKTTTLRVAGSLAAGRGTVPVMLSPAFYEPRTLERRVQRELELVAKRRLSPASVGAALGAEDVLLVVDGVTELPQVERNALVADLWKAKDKYPRLAFLVCGRDESFLAGLDARLFRIQDLSQAERREIAGALTSSPVDAYRAVASVEELLGRGAGIPLLFLMSLRSEIEGEGIGNKNELYEGFLHRLRLPGGGSVDNQLLAEQLVGAALMLQVRGRYAATQGWWIQSISAALNTGSAGGSADELLAQAQQVGLLCPRSDGMIGFLHDSFRDYLVAIGLRTGSARLSEDVGPEWEEAISFAAEAGSLSESDVETIAKSNLVALARAAIGERGEDANCMHSAPATLLRSIVDSHLSNEAREGAGVAGAAIRTFQDSQGLWICFSTSGVDGDLSRQEFRRATEDATLVFGFARRDGLLEPILRVWFALFSDALADGITSAAPRLASAEPNELAVEIVRTFQDRRAAVERMALASTTLADRLIERVAWTGIDGLVVAPGEPAKWRLEHSFWYRHQRGGESVRVVDSETALREARLWPSRATCSAERFVEESASGEAYRALSDAAQGLLGIDR